MQDSSLLPELNPYQNNSNSPLYFPPLVGVPGAGHPCTGADVLLLPELVLPWSCTSTVTSCTGNKYKSFRHWHMIQDVEAEQDNQHKNHEVLIKADQQHNLTNHIKDSLLYLSLQTTLASRCSAILASSHQSSSSCITSPVTLKYPPTDTPSTLHYSLKNLIHSGITGSPNRDPARSVDTDPLPTRNPERDYLTFVEHKLSVCLFHSSVSSVFNIIVHFPCDYVYRKIMIIFPTSGAFRNIAK